MSIFHPLTTRHPLPEKMNNPFDYEPDVLALEACKQLQSTLPTSPKEGKMYGVLVCEKGGETGFLQAYSGQVEAEQDGFVPAVFDYLQPDGYFKVHEQEISNINQEIELIKLDPTFMDVKEQLAALEDEAKRVIERQKAEIKEAKKKRDERRKEENLSPEEEQRLIKESQYLKAELHRTKLFYRGKMARTELQLHPFTVEIEALQRKRSLLSDQLQAWLFHQFIFLNGKGQEKDLLTIFKDYFLKQGGPSALNRSYRLRPPSGAGECCEPKLLQYAFQHGYKPFSMAMFWWGPSPKQEIREHKHFYPACNGKCKPILSWMLEGLEVEIGFRKKLGSTNIEVLYEDDYLAVIEKPTGLLSVPGKGKEPSVYSVLKEKWADQCIPYMVHRLDMDTSGLMVVAKDESIYHALQQQFIHRAVKKRYTALLPTSILTVNIPQKGVISLPLAPDLMDRPRKKVDFEKGKRAETLYEIMGKVKLDNPYFKEAACIRLYPKTGRTHQLRIHCAHPLGLHTPILGDNLYGAKADRLHLYADYLAFTHPKTGKEMEFHSKGAV